MLSSALTAPLEIAKFVFSAVYVIATIGVAVGVYWEREEFPKEKRDRGWRVLIISLAVDTLFTILVFATDGWIGAIQRTEIIGLETKLAARTIFPSEASAIESRLAPFHGQSFEVITYWDDAEALSISNKIAGVLISAGWKLEQPTRYTTLLGVATGVEVFSDPRADAATQETAKQLVEALNTADLAARRKASNPNPNDPVKTKITVDVGIKP